jgi:hypothetical protein
LCPVQPKSHDERTIQPGGTEHLPPPVAGAPGETPALHDPRALQILTTEHWSLLSARSLVYNEAFARAGMFLTFLSASLVALALVAQGMGFDRDFLVLSAIMLLSENVAGTIERAAEALTPARRPPWRPPGTRSRSLVRRNLGPPSGADGTSSATPPLQDLPSRMLR